MHLDNDFYFVVCKQCRTEMRRWVTNTISLYKLTNVLFLFIYFKLVMKFIHFVNFIIYFQFSKNIFSMLKITLNVLMIKEHELIYIKILY